MSSGWKRLSRQRRFPVAVDTGYPGTDGDDASGGSANANTACTRCNTAAKRRPRPHWPSLRHSHSPFASNHRNPFWIRAFFLSNVPYGILGLNSFRRITHYLKQN